MTDANSEGDSDLTLLDQEALLDDVYDFSLKMYYKDFVDEAFDFYSTNAKIWEDFEHEPLYDLLEEVSFSYFTLPIRKTVVSLAYLFRGTYRKYFKQTLRHLRNVDVFIKLVIGYSLNKDGFFLHFASWIAYVFELNLFCKIHRIDHEEICKACLNSCPGVSYFKVGGFLGLETTCNSVSYFYEIFAKTFHGNYPRCDILLPFIHALGVVEREFKYDNTILQIARLHVSEDLKYETLPKFRALSYYNPERIVLGYRARRKIMRQDESEKFSNESSEIHENVHLAERTQQGIEVSPDASPGKATSNPNYPLKSEYTMSFFVVTDRYLSKRQEAKDNAYESEYKRDIKIFSTNDGKIELVEGLMNVLDENIEKNNLRKITDEVFAVYPSESDDKFDDKIIVLETSSEEEDDDPQLEPLQGIFMKRAIPVLRKWKYCTSNDDAYLKRSYENRYKLKYELKCKPARDEETTEIDMKSTGAVPKEMNTTEENVETKKKKKRVRKKKQQPEIPVESTEIKQEMKSIESKFETTVLLPGNITEEISMENLGAKIKACVEQTLENEEEMHKCMLATTFLAMDAIKQKYKDISITKRVPANTRKEEISRKTAGAKGKNSVQQNIEKSETRMANVQQKEISMKTAGAKGKNSIQQNIEKGETRIANVQQKEISMKTAGAKGKNSIQQNIEKSETRIANVQQKEISMKTAGAKGKNSVQQNIKKSETRMANVQQKEISMRNTGAIPKKQIPSKECNKNSKKSSKKPESSRQTTGPVEKDEHVLSSVAESMKKLELDD